MASTAIAAIFCAILIAGLQADKGIAKAGDAYCHFGTLPGGWIKSQEGSPFPLYSEDGGTFPTWQPYSQECQLKPLLGPYLQAAAKPDDDSFSGLKPLNVLLFGDSVDYRVARHLCNVSKHQEVLEPFGSDPIGQEHNMTGICRTPKLVVAKQHISSASLEGPYWWNMNFPPLPSITEGLKAFQAAEGVLPDIVSIATNYWDVAALFEAGGFKFDGTPLEHQVLPEEWLRNWTSNVTTILSYLKDSVPESTLLVYHTAHLPQQVDKPNKWESDRYLYPHISQMNAAGRHVAQTLHYHILDTEAMGLQLPKEAMMADITHPGAGFMMQVLNMMLNMEKEQKQARNMGGQSGQGVQWQRQHIIGRGWFKG